FSSAGDGLHRPHVHFHLEDAAGFGAAETRREHRERFRGAESQQSREGYEEASRGNCEDQACRSQYHQPGVSDAHRNGYGAQHGPGSRGSLEVQALWARRGAGMAKKSGTHVENARRRVDVRPYKLGEAAELLKKTDQTSLNDTAELAIGV